jgi:hypothetical protein
MALPPRNMICSPACAASGWLVVTMACGAITSARLCARQPSARSPRTASHAGAFVFPKHADNGGGVCAIVEDVKHGSANVAATSAEIFTIVPICPIQSAPKNTDAESTIDRNRTKDGARLQML